MTPLFSGDDILEVRITAPLSTIMRNRDSKDEVDGTFQYMDADGTPIDLKIYLQTRGNFRNRPDVCRFAPLRLNFRKDVDGTLFDGQNKLKLVTHCGNGRRYEEAVIREYLAYKVFNMLSDISFRVRLLRVTYVDSERKNKESAHFGFLIEHRNALTARTGIPKAEISKIDVTDLRPEYTNLTSLFHHFIGNTDFSQIRPEPDDHCCHNHAVFGRAGEAYYSVPYDFDMSGFVKAPHSKPTSKSRLKHVRQRRYRGWCDFNMHLPTHIASFQDKRSAIVELVSSEHRQRPGERKALLKFIDAFYDAVKSEKQIDKKLLRDCKQSARAKH